MSPEIFLALIGMALSASLTPGPNNSMLASSGATYGFRATLPHMLGISFGYPVMIFLVSIGLGEVFRHSQPLQQVMRLVGALMMLWIAWRIANASPPGSTGKRTRPLGFVPAAGFQWVNPKGWVAAIAISSQFVVASAPVLTAAMVAMVFVVSGLVSSFAWVVFGQMIGGWLHTPLRLRVFNIAMALLLVAFLLVILFQR